MFRDCFAPRPAWFSLRARLGKTGTAALMSALLGLCSCTGAASRLGDARHARTTFDQRRNREDVAGALAEYEAVITAQPDNSAALLGATRAAIWLAADTTSDRLRAAHARKGIRYAEAALAAHPDSVDARFLRAVSMGYMAQAEPARGTILAGKMRDIVEQLAREAPEHDHGGPHRFLGALYRETPEGAVFGGDMQVSREHLEKALAIDGEYPENSLEMARWYLASAEDEPVADQRNRLLAQARRWANRVLEQQNAAEPELDMKRYRAQAREIIGRARAGEGHGN